MATSKQIRSYAKEHNCSNAEAKAHFIEQAVQKVKENYKSFLDESDGSQDGFRPDAGISMAMADDTGIVVNVSEFVSNVTQTSNQFGGFIFHQVDDKIEITETVGLSNDTDRDYCGTLWFDDKTLDAFITEIEKGAFNIEMRGTPAEETKSGNGEKFRPIIIEDVNVRGCYSDAGSDFTTFSMAGSVSHGDFAKQFRQAINNKVVA